MPIIEKDMLETEDDKIGYLINNPYTRRKDILSHEWEKTKDSKDTELFLKCKKCGYYYGVVIFNNGMKARIFVPHKKARETQSFVCCKAATMRKALE